MSHPEPTSPMSPPPPPVTWSVPAAADPAPAPATRGVSAPATWVVSATPAPPLKPRRWIVVSVAVWVVLLAGSAIWAIARGGATDREETTVAQAIPVVDRATTDLVGAASADQGSIAVVSDLLPAGTCKVTLARSGSRYQRVVTALTPPGGEEALLHEVARRLPASYGASVTSGAAPRLAADAGLYVAVDAAAVGAGVVRFVVDTGACRATGDLHLPAAATATADQRAPIDALLARLHLTAGDVNTVQLACPAGGSLISVSTHAVGTPGNLDAVLRDLPGVTPVVSNAATFAYRDGTTEVAARTAGDGVDLSATTPCPSR